MAPDGELDRYRLTRRHEALAVALLAFLLVVALGVGAVSVVVINRQATTIAGLSDDVHVNRHLINDLRRETRDLRLELHRRPPPT